MKTSSMIRWFAPAVAAVAAIGLSFGGAGLWAQEQNKKPDPAAEMEAWEQLQKPGPEHEHLKKFVGEWTAEVTCTMPDGTPMKSTGKESAKLVLGGRFVQTHFEGSMMGKPFTGMGMMGYDKMLKKYVSTWSDSMSTGIMIFYGDADKDGKVFTQYCETKVADGKTEKWKSVTTLTDEKTMTFDMTVTLPDGKDMKVMSITYTKVK